MCNPYWWIIDHIRYPKCSWKACGNMKEGKCVKLSPSEFHECKMNMRKWGRWV